MQKKKQTKKGNLGVVLVYAVNYLILVEKGSLGINNKNMYFIHKSDSSAKMLFSKNARKKHYSI